MQCQSGCAGGFNGRGPRAGGREPRARRGCRGQDGRARGCAHLQQVSPRPHKVLAHNTRVHPCPHGDSVLGLMMHLSLLLSTAVVRKAAASGLHNTVNTNEFLISGKVTSCEPAE
jgi:hypothetical protein